MRSEFRMVQVAAALAAGCCVVLKPSELTPYTCLDLAVLAHKVRELEIHVVAGVAHTTFGIIVIAHKVAKHASQQISCESYACRDMAGLARDVRECAWDEVVIWTQDIEGSIMLLCSCCTVHLDFKILR